MDQMTGVENAGLGPMNR